MVLDGVMNEQARERQEKKEKETTIMTRREGSDARAAAVGGRNRLTQKNVKIGNPVTQ